MNSGTDDDAVGVVSVIAVSTLMAQLFDVMTCVFESVVYLLIQMYTADSGCFDAMFVYVNICKFIYL
jgi:hypothetical protein